MIDGGLRRIFHKALICATWQAIESGSTGGGIPDSHYCFPGPKGNGDGITGWVEFKRTKAFAIKFQPEQIGWIDRYTRYGGRCWIAIRQMREENQRTIGQDNLWLIHGRNVKALNATGLKCFLDREESKKLDNKNQTIIWHNIDMSITAQVWSGGSRFWDWKSIEKLLRS